MPKNIILCSDGTGQTGGKGNNTNVWRIFKSIDLAGFGTDGSRRHVEQRAFYDDGVGTSRPRWWALFCGAFGYGLSRNVKQLYTILAANFDPGDHIYLFGFSRGAFTVRTLAGLINTCGVISRYDSTEDRYLDDEELEKRVKKAYKAYRQRYSAKLCCWFKKKFRVENIDVDQFRRTYGVRVTREQYDTYDGIVGGPATGHHVPIRFIGIWDTVDAVGFPWDRVANCWNKYIYQYKFPNYRLSDYINKACHALAIDEERGSFKPLMFDQRPYKDGQLVEHAAPEDDRRIDQVWFAGVHSNVGGGYPKQGMAHVALNWMIAKAEEQELHFNDYYKTRYQAAANIHDKLYDSRSGLAVYYRYQPRKLEDYARYAPIKVHASTFRRILARTEGYAPGNLTVLYLKQAIADRFTMATNDDNRPEAILNLGLAERAPIEQKSRLEKARKRFHTWFVLATLTPLAAACILGKILAPSSGVLIPVQKVVEAAATTIPLVGGVLYNVFLEPLFRNLAVGLIIMGLSMAIYLRGRQIEKKQIRAYQRFWRRTFTEGKWPDSQSPSPPYCEANLVASAAFAAGLGAEPPHLLHAAKSDG